MKNPGCRCLCLGIVGMLSLFLGAASCRPLRAASSSGPQPLEVATLEYPDLRDPARDGRRVPVKVHYPAPPGRYPLVLVSHGGGGDWDSHFEQAQDLARHGFVVFCLQHVGSDTEAFRRRVKELGLRKTREAIHRLTIDSAEVQQRPRDLSFAIDRAVEWDRDPGKLQGKIDANAIAALGHSYGAYTVLAACGARPMLDHLVPRVEPGKGLGSSLSERRIKAGIALSPQGTGGTYWQKESYASIDRPLLMLSGSKDNMNAHDGSDLPAERRKEAFDFMPSGGKLLFWLEGADHLAFYDSDKTLELRSASREDAQRITRALTVAFCNLHLKGQQEAKARLAEESANALCGKSVTKVTLYEK